MTAAPVKLPREEIDPDGLLEYSVVFTDRSLNHMSTKFVAAMQQVLSVLESTYNAATSALIPGGGSCAMEAVARQLATGKRVLVLRNGFFSYRWSQIIQQGAITDEVTVMRARQLSEEPQAAWEPAPIEEVVAKIREKQPEVVFAPHVETASGMILPDAYLRAVADATHEVGGLFVLDCIASGAMWVDMQLLGIDVLISAPQKGWSGSPGTGFVMLNADAAAAVEATTSTSFALDLKKWIAICDEYRAGRAAYHATMATDTIVHNLGPMLETQAQAEPLRAAQAELGTRVRAMLAERGFASVAAHEYAAPGVVVVYTDDPDMKSTAKLKPAGVQAAAGVPLFCDEPEGFSTFRLGLFGLDKLGDVDGTVDRLAAALDEIGYPAS